MRRSALWLLVVLLVPLAAGAVRLRHQFRVGQELRYQEAISAEGSLSLETALGDQVIPVKIDAREQRSMKTTAQAGEGEFWVESRSLSSSATVTVQGQTQREQPPGQNLKMRVNTLGQVRDVEMLESREGDDVDLDLGLDSLTSVYRLAGFPPDDLQVGATWDREVPVRRGEQTATAKVSSRLARLDGGVATIASRYEMPLPPTSGTLKMMGLSIPVRVQGKSVGQTTTLWDVAAGRATKTTSQGTVEIELMLVGLSETPANGTFDVSSTSTLQRE